jgi:hypothetical protein
MDFVGHAPGDSLFHGGDIGVGMDADDPDIGLGEGAIREVAEEVEFAGDEIAIGGEGGAEVEDAGDGDSALAEMGFDRGGWYAVDALEKLFGVGRFATGWSARRIVPELQALAVGDRVPLSRSRWLDVSVITPPHELVLVLPPGRLRWTWRFVLAPEADGSTSTLTVETLLALPARGAVARVAVRAAWALFDVGHGVMESVQLRTIARRAAAAHC